MPKISCSVVSCSYNQGNICSASILNIVGAKANITEETSCSTYINKEKVSNAVDDKVKIGETEAVLCEVETCIYHVRSHCSLADGIEVSNLGEAETYRDTDCLSFERRSE